MPGDRRRSSWLSRFSKPCRCGDRCARNLELALRLRGLQAGARTTRVEEIAERFDIASLLPRNAQRLSVGEAQRLNLARALLLRAPVTLLDEPFASLDAPSRAELVDQLPSWLADPPTTAVVVTHDREEALRIADDLVLLDGGEVVAHGSPPSLLEAPPSPRAAELLGFALLKHEDALIAVPPGALVMGKADGGPQLEMRVDRVVDLGSERQAVGMIGDTRARARIPAGDAQVAPGATCSVRASRHVRF